MSRFSRKVMSPDEVKAKQDEIQRKKEENILETLWNTIESMLLEKAKQPVMSATLFMDEIVAKLDQIDIICVMDEIVAKLDQIDYL
jgi:hypothetical protein